MHKVFSHENLAIVHSAKSLLKLNNINCFLKNEFHASGGHVGCEAVPIELWVVDDEQQEKAITLIEDELAPDEEGSDWQFANCGEKNNGYFETCWNCQQPAPG